jgi:hypothetical protein
MMMPAKIKAITTDTTGTQALRANRSKLIR